jgi:hypothetical protein
MVVLCLLVLKGQAPAQVDQDTDGLGIYFDTDATQYCLEYVGGWIFAYLILTNCSEPTGIAGWECRITSTIPPGNFAPGWDLYGADNSSWPPNYECGLGWVIPHAPAMLLARQEFWINVPDAMTFYVGPVDSPSIPGYPAYAVGGDPGRIKPMYPVSGSYLLPVAQLNGVCVVIGTESTTFGHFKALYR